VLRVSAAGAAIRMQLAVPRVADGDGWARHCAERPASGWRDALRRRPEAFPRERWCPGRRSPQPRWIVVQRPGERASARPSPAAPQASICPVLRRWLKPMSVTSNSAVLFDAMAGERQADREPDLVRVPKRAALDALLDPEAVVAVPGPSVPSVPRRRPPPEARSCAAKCCSRLRCALGRHRRVAVHDQPLARGSSHDALEQPRSASTRGPSSTFSPGEPFPAATSPW
jgi:hypothetical protein